MSHYIDTPWIRPYKYSAHSYAAECIYCCAWLQSPGKMSRSSGRPYQRLETTDLYIVIILFTYSCKTISWIYKICIMMSSWSERISKTNIRVIEQKTVISLILYLNLTSKFKNYNMIRPSKWRERFVCPLTWIYLLFSFPEENVKLNDVIPGGNFATGLAWSHFTGYLKIILPGNSYFVLWPFTINFRSKIKLASYRVWVCKRKNFLI